MDFIIVQRVKNRLAGEKYDCGVIEELAQTIEDRLCLRLGANTLPSAFFSIAAEATVKAYRRIYYEGISSESFAINTSVSFVEDILSEYDREIEAYLNGTDTAGNARNSRTVTFI